MFNKGIKLTEE